MRNTTVLNDDDDDERWDVFGSPSGSRKIISASWLSFSLCFCFCVIQIFIVERACHQHKHIHHHHESSQHALLYDVKQSFWCSELYAVRLCSSLSVMRRIRDVFAGDIITQPGTNYRVSSVHTRLSSCSYFHLLNTSIWPVCVIYCSQRHLTRARLLPFVLWFSQMQFSAKHNVLMTISSR